MSGPEPTREWRIVGGASNAPFRRPTTDESEARYELERAKEEDAWYDARLETRTVTAWEPTK